MTGPTWDESEKQNRNRSVNRKTQCSVGRGNGKRPEDQSMSSQFGWGLAVAVGMAVMPASRAAEELTPAQRGERALLGRSFLPGTISLSAYDNAWRVWSDDAQSPPKDFPRTFMDRYGLHPSPYPNGRYPMGLRETKGLLGKGIATDCMICHGGSIAGKSYVGLGNASLDFQAFIEELAKADGGQGRTPFAFCNVRGTSGARGM